MAERSQVLPLRCDWQRALHAKDQVLALQGMQEAVQRHGRHADAPDTPAATDMGSGDLLSDGRPELRSGLFGSGLLLRLGRWGGTRPASRKILF